MGFSEMGIAQTDEYQETYDRFMEEYDTGKPIQAICADIISDMTEEFGADNGILHGVYYALAKCQWMCGGVEEALLGKVSKIIQSGADLSFYRELGAEEQDLRLRKRSLDRFYRGLLVPRKTVRHRKKPESEYVPAPRIPRPAFAPLPAVQPGYVLAYPDGDQWRVFLVMDVRKTREFGQTACCFLWAEKFPQVPCVGVLMKSRGMPLGLVPGDAFPDAFEVVGWIPPEKGIPGLIGHAYPMWRDWLSQLTNRERFYRDLPSRLCLNFETVTGKISNIVNGIR